MSKKQCQEHIPIYTPAEVFEAGTYVDTIPKVDGFVLQTDGERFKEGLAVHIGLVVAHKSFELDAEVTEFEPYKHVLIKGASHIGKAKVWLDLAPHKKNGTTIDYGIEVRHSLLTKFAEPLVAHHLETTMPLFAAGYKQNVINRLQADTTAQRRAA